MTRVLVTGGAGTIGAAVVRRLLADPAFDVRVSDQRAAPQWMREGCEVHTGDLRELEQARAAMDGCPMVIHLAAIVGGIGNFHKLPHTLTEVNNGLYNAIYRAALDHEVERFTYVSSSMVFERATEFPTTEAHLPDCPTPQSAYGFSKLTGEVYVVQLTRARPALHDLPALQRLWARGDARGRAWDRAHGARPDQEGPLRTASAPDLRLRRADAHAHPHRRHRRRRGHRDVLARRAERGFQHLSLARADRRRDGAHHLGGLRRGPEEVQAEAPADIRGRRAAALAVG